MSFSDGHKRTDLRLRPRALASGERPGLPARRSSSLVARKLRRRMRRWLDTNGLTIVLVFAMMVFAWMIANH